MVVTGLCLVWQNTATRKTEPAAAPNRCPPVSAQLRWQLSLGRVVPCPQRLRCSRRAWNTRSVGQREIEAHGEIRFAPGPRSRSRAGEIELSTREAIAPAHTAPRIA